MNTLIIKLHCQTILRVFFTLHNYGNFSEFFYLLFPMCAKIEVLLKMRIYLLEGRIV